MHPRDLASLAGEETIFGGSAAEKLRRLQAELEPLSRRYDVVAANPPYMGSKNMNKWLGDWVKTTRYKDVKGDLFSCFMVRNVGMGTEHAQLGFMTPYVWMFIGTYEKLRKFVIQQNTITSLIQLEYSGFSGATVPICTFTVQKGYCPGYRGGYVRLSDFVGADQQAPRALEALANPECGWFYRADASSFEAIPGSPIAYWASTSLCNAFKSAKPISSYMNSRSGITAGSSDFVRYWHEVALTQIGFNCKTYRDMGQKRWFPINSGGTFRMFYGNNEKIINLWNDGVDIKNSGCNYRLREKEYYFKRGITWGRITSADISFRATAPGTLFGDAGPVGFVESKQDYLLGFLSTNILKVFADILNPTLNCQITDIERIPLIIDDDRQRRVESYVKECMALSEQDWDSFEESWDFLSHPLL